MMLASVESMHNAKFYTHLVMKVSIYPDLAYLEVLSSPSRAEANLRPSISLPWSSALFICMACSLVLDLASSRALSWSSIGVDGCEKSAQLIINYVLSEIGAQTLQSYGVLTMMAKLLELETEILAVTPIFQ